MLRIWLQNVCEYCTRVTTLSFHQHKMFAKYELSTLIVQLALDFHRVSLAF